MLVLDGMVQTTERDEFVYHEMIAHVAMQTHPHPSRVAVIGGGDGGAVREVLKYSTVEEVVLVEIDEKVVQASRTYLPAISRGLDDPRVRCLYTDGIAHIEGTSAGYDVILVDSTEPVGPAVGLFGEPFYAACHRALTDQGVLVAQTESPFYNASLLAGAARAIGRLFRYSGVYLASIPTYPSGLWSFTIGSKAVDPLEVEPDLSSIETRYYTGAVHRGAFALPRFVHDILREPVKEGD